MKSKKRELLVIIVLQLLFIPFMLILHPETNNSLHSHLQAGHFDLDGQKAYILSGPYTTTGSQLFLAEINGGRFVIMAKKLGMLDRYRFDYRPIKKYNPLYLIDSRDKLNIYMRGDVIEYEASLAITDFETLLVLYMIGWILLIVFVYRNFKKPSGIEE